jgi:hypothetical protein
MSMIEIKPADGLSRFLTFCKIPRLIYRGRTGFAPCLDAERWTLYAPKLNPHYKQVESQSWLAYRDGKPAGRISAQIYKDGITPVEASRAQFGNLDAIEDETVVAKLAEAAESWLKSRGETLVHGPFSPSINGEMGMLIDGFDATPMFLMPWHPAYLGTMLERQGYTKIRDVMSYRYDITDTDRDAVPKIITRAEWRDRLKIRTLDLKSLKTESAIIVEIFNDAWSQNWGFVPFTLEEFLSVADSLKYVMPPEGGFMIELDGTAQAFGIFLPNLHEITADLDGRLFPFGLPKLISRLRNHVFKTGRIVLFGMRRDLQKKAVGGVVLLAFIEELRRRANSVTGASIDHAEFGWVLENNLGMRKPIEMSGAKVDKVHRIYEKRL